MAVRTGYVVTLIVVLFVGLVVFVIRSDKVAPQPEMSAATTPQLKPYTETIDAAFIVPKLSDKAYKFVLPAGAKDAVLQGHFAATGGARNDIEVWVMNDDGYVNWQNRHSITPIYNSGKITQGTLNVSLPSDAGTYYLVFNNRFSFLSPKAVQDNVSLQYKH